MSNTIDIAQSNVFDGTINDENPPSDVPAPRRPKRDRSTRASQVGLPTAPPKARNTTWIVVGLVLVIVAGVAASSLWRGLSDRVDVLVAANLIEAGQVVTETDLTTASIAADDRVRAISPDRANELIGQVASGPIGVGSIVHPAQFVIAETGDEPTVVVGAALEPGQYPIVGLLPGDRVRVIEVSGPNVLIGEEAEPREITIGEIVEVHGLQRGDQFLVSIRINESANLLVSERAQQGRISLALLDSDFPEDLIDPLEPAQPVEPGEPLDPPPESGDADAADEDASNQDGGS